jgi:hypothetical protein
VVDDVLTLTLPEAEVADAAPPGANRCAQSTVVDGHKLADSTPHPSVMW